MVEIPEKIKKFDFSYIKLMPNSKMPCEKNWNKIIRPHTSEKIKNWKGNYGIIIKNGFVVIDFDDNKMVEKYFDKFPKTFTVKTGSGMFHLYFRTDISEDFKIRDKKTGKSFIDVLGTGRQVVGANSIHPNGNKYQVHVDSDIEYISMEKIKFIFRDELPEKIRYKHPMDVEGVNKKIKEKIKISDLMREYGYDVSRNPTMCLLGHESESKSCFSWDDSKGVWHCFHCEKGGTIFDFVMYHENENFHASRKRLLKKANISESMETAMGSLSITNYVENVRKFFKIQPFFFDQMQVFWFWDFEMHKYKIVDNIDVMRLIDKALNFDGETVKGHIKSNYIEAFKWVGRENHPLPQKKTWIQFKDKIFDFETSKTFEASAEYFVTNPIPFEIGSSSDTPVIDQLFCDWVGEKNKELLYEIIAYCCLADYPIHKIFCFIGVGRNGKSKYLNLINNFLGAHNSTSSDLESLISSRFESAKLYKKLFCLLGETNFSNINNTGILKRLCGQDLVSFEFKNKNPIDDFNYAKILIATNSLPSSGDTSDGFYRRWMIIDFFNNFDSNVDILKSIPVIEYNNLCVKVIQILPKLIRTGKFSNEDKNIEETKRKFMMASNPLPLYLDEFFVRDVDGFVLHNTLFSDYQQYLFENKKRRVSRKEFNSVLEQSGFSKRKTTKKIGDVFEVGYYVEGLKKK